MTVFTEAPRTGEHVVREPYGTDRRSVVTVLSGQNLGAGAIIGSVLSGTIASAVKASGANTGTGTCVVDGTTPIQPRAKLGTYTLRFTTTTNIRLEDPDGKVLGDYAIGGSNGNSVTITEQIKVAVTQASTTFAAGDGFDVTISAITEKVAEYNPTATNGSQIATGIMYGAVNATGGDKKGVANTRDMIFNSNLVTWKSGLTTAQKALALQHLADRGITKVD
jgi:hypothetical protein